MSDVLNAAVEAGREALAGRGDGHLPRAARLGVLRALGDTAPDGYAAVAASAAVVQRALPLWDRERPLDGRAELLVRAALSSRETVDEAKPRALEFHREVEELFGTIPDDAGFAAWAASALVDVAALGFEDEVPDDADDDDLDFDARAPENLAELALTGDDPAANVENRRALWQWWLDEAVPAAAQAGPRPS